MAGESDITQKTLLICKGQELTMSPTQGQADNIERTIPYQPFTFLALRTVTVGSQSPRGQLYGWLPLSNAYGIPFF
jgi:hypothetical protein